MTVVMKFTAALACGILASAAHGAVGSVRVPSPPDAPNPPPKPLPPTSDTPPVMVVPRDVERVPRVPRSPVRPTFPNAGGYDFPNFDVGGSFTSNMPPIPPEIAKGFRESTAARPVDCLDDECGDDLDDFDDYSYDIPNNPVLFFSSSSDDILDDEEDDAFDFRLSDSVYGSIE